MVAIILNPNSFFKYAALGPKQPEIFSKNHNK